MNDRCFEDHKRTLEELNIYFLTLCIFGHLHMFVL
jgi:hypothetical protein